MSGTLITSRLFWLIFFAITAYWVIVTIFPYGAISPFLIPLQLSTATAVIFVYGGAFLEDVREDKYDYRTFLLIGIVLGWCAVAGHGLWSIFGSLSGISINTEQSKVTGFLSWLASLGALWHVTAPGVKGPNIPRANWQVLMIAVGGGGIIGGALLTWLIMR